MRINENYQQLVCIEDERLAKLVMSSAERMKNVLCAFLRKAKLKEKFNFCQTTKNHYYSTSVPPNLFSEIFFLTHPLPLAPI